MLKNNNNKNKKRIGIVMSFNLMLVASFQWNKKARSFENLKFVFRYLSFFRDVCFNDF